MNVLKSWHLFLFSGEAPYLRMRDRKNWIFKFTYIKNHISLESSQKVNKTYFNETSISHWKCLKAVHKVPNYAYFSNLKINFEDF